jgi:hypothetical protein
MADEPLGLHTFLPIPADGDYDAICAALRQTVRGRWFLEECARRSLNGQTTALSAGVPPSNGAIRGQPFLNPQMDVFAVAERLQDLAWTMRERALDQGMCEQMEALAGAILSTSALRDQGRLQKLSEALGHLEQRVQTMLGAAAEGAETPHSRESRSDSSIVDVDEELFAVSSDASARPIRPVEAPSSPPPRISAGMRSDILAALNAMSGEEKIALFT